MQKRAYSTFRSLLNAVNSEMKTKWSKEKIARKYPNLISSEKMEKELKDSQESQGNLPLK